MSIVRVGATKQYSDNWENIFARGGSRNASTRAAVAKQPRQSAKKKPAKKKAAKKAARRK